MTGDYLFWGAKNNHMYVLHFAHFSVPVFTTHRFAWRLMRWS